MCKTIVNEKLSTSKCELCGKVKYIFNYSYPQDKDKTVHKIHIHGKTLLFVEIKAFIEILSCYYLNKKSTWILFYHKDN